MIRFVVTFVSVSFLMACGGASSDYESEPSGISEIVEEQSHGIVERLDPVMDALIPPDAVIEKLADGFSFVEGPAWISDGDGYLLFSDIPANRILKWTPDGQVTDFLSPVYEGDYGEGQFVGSNGIILDSEGRVVFTEHFNGRISRIESDGSLSIVVDNYEGLRLNSPNDLAYHSDGSLYFTDPPYGLPTPDARELDVNGIYRLRPDGTLTLLGDQPAPNGIAFSPDESQLYVADSMTGEWMIYEVSDDGTLGDGEVFFDSSNPGSSSGQPISDGAADGLKVDALGNVWATGPGGVWIFTADGRHLGTIKPTEIPANVAWGDEDGRTLYMTARTGLYRIRVNVAGNGW